MRNKFKEDPAIRQFMYGMTGARDRNGGGVPSGNSAFAPGFFGAHSGSKGLDIDAANFEMWKRKQMEEQRLNRFMGPESSPRSIFAQDMFAGNRNTSTNPFFGNPGRR